MYPLFQQGGSSGSGGSAPQGGLSGGGFSAAQLRRGDAVSQHIMGYQPKVTPEARATAAAQRAAAAALREAKQRERINKSAAAEVARQQKQLERMMKRGG